MSPNRSRPLVIAHRGDSASAPEQTLAAFEQAVVRGADMIEVDVRRALDGELVLLHDARVDRTTDGGGRVDTLSFAELRQLDAGGWFAPSFAGERIPSMNEAFELAERSGVALCLEAKGSSPAECASIAVALARELLARGRLQVDVIASFDHAALAAAAYAAPGLRTAPDRVPERGPTSGRALVAQARAAGAAVIQHHHEDLTAEAVAEVHRAGLAIWAWPPRTVADVTRMLELTVDGVMGDDVELIVSVLAHVTGSRRASDTAPSSRTI